MKSPKGARAAQRGHAGDPRRKVLAQDPGFHTPKTLCVQALRDFVIDRVNCGSVDWKYFELNPDRPIHFRSVIDGEFGKSQFRPPISCELVVAVVIFSQPDGKTAYRGRRLFVFPKPVGMMQ